MADLIDRQAAIDAVRHSPIIEVQPAYMLIDKADVLKNLVMIPSAQPEYRIDEWCTDCKEYDHERHCCPRFNHVIRTTLQEAQERKKGKWINAYPDIEPNPMFMYGICSVCGFEQSISDKLKYCPNCGARMEDE